MNFNMSTEDKEGLIGLLLGGVVFFILTRTLLKKKEEAPKVLVTEENVGIALNAYTSAVQNNEPQSVLNDLNTATAKDYGLRVYQRRNDGKFVVTDLDGKEVKVV